MDALSFLSGLGAALGAALAFLNIREKLWPRQTAPHPLEDALRDIARAIRPSDRDASLHDLQLHVLALTAEVRTLREDRA